jgi:serine/threonine protein kinase
MSQKLCVGCQKTIKSNVQFCPYCGQQQTTSALTGQLSSAAMLDGRYVIDTLIGQGGMGAVYRAVDTRLTGRVCAIKEMSVLTLPLDEQAQAVKNFGREAQLLADLHHPHLPKVYDFFQDGNSGRHYLVMDYVQGTTLEELLEQQGHPFSEQQVRTWGLQLCDVLSYLHSQNPPIIFRDLKPDNIMIDQHGQLKLIDFGIARFFKPARSTDTQAFGTIGYVPPEQHGRSQTDARSDVYGLGATMWRLLTAEDPADNPYQLHGVRFHNPAISAELEAIVRRAMQLQPDARFQTAQAFRNALLGQADDVVVQKPEQEAPRFPAWAVVALLVLVFVAGGAGLFLLNDSSPVTGLEPTNMPGPGVVADNPGSDTPTVTHTPTSSPTDTPTAMPESPTPSPTPLPSPTATPSSAAALPSSQIGMDGVEMVLVPAGEFTMGSTSQDVDFAVTLCTQSGNRCPRSDFTNELPQRTVYVSSFYIDITPITNALYRACVDARVCAAPSDANTPDNRYRVSNYYNLPQYNNYPVVRIRWEDAQTYCQWAGKRLPTEAEWEKAARGTDGRIFPWGNQFENRRANTRDRGVAELQSVASYPDGRSPYGLYDMSGTVWEYVADWYSDTYYHDAPSRDPQGPTSGSVRVLRGGSYSDHKEYARVTNRGAYNPNFSRSGFRGFRCAQSIP